MSKNIVTQSIIRERLQAAMLERVMYPATRQGVRNLNPGPVSRLIEQGLADQAKAIEEAEGLREPTKVGEVVNLRKESDHDRAAMKVAKRYGHMQPTNKVVVVKKVDEKVSVKLDLSGIKL